MMAGACLRSIESMLWMGGSEFSSNGTRQPAGTDGEGRKEGRKERVSERSVTGEDG